MDPTGNKEVPDGLIAPNFQNTSLQGVNPPKFYITA